MNIYSLNPQWLKNNALEVIINILKVKKVYCFITSNDYDRLKNVEILKWNGRDFDSFLNNCVYDFVNSISEPVFYHGEYTGEKIVKNMYNDSLNLNPIYNIENLNDPNILFLWSPESPKGIVAKFRKYSMNILNKYGSIDYMERICFYYFDSYLSCSRILIKDYMMNDKWNYKTINAVIYIRYNGYDVETKVSREIDHSYDPLLSYLFMKTNNILEGETLQERLITKKGNILFEYNTLKGYSKYKNSYWDNYEIDDSYFDDVCKAEEKYIMNNGGDWIYD